MSATVPYVAPWQTGFDKYSSQLYSPTVVGGVTLQMTVPTGQWWRVLYATGTFVTSAIAQNRIMEFQVVDASSVSRLIVISTQAQTASTTTTYLFMATSAAYTNQAVASAGFALSPIPDILWPFGSTIELQCVTSVAGDAFMTAGTFAVEVYTEDRPGVLTPTPTPLIP